MSGRNWFRDDPIRDAEDWAAREDPRPLAGHCEICGCELHNSCPGWDPDDGYEIEGVVICDDCIREYFKDRRLR